MTILMVLGGVVLVAFFMLKTLYFNNMMVQEGIDSKEEKIYQYQFEMIVDNPESAFW